MSDTTDDIVLSERDRQRNGNIGMGLLVFLVIAFILGMLWQDHLDPMPAPERITNTVTETVRVPGPTVTKTVNVFSRDCENLIDLTHKIAASSSRIARDQTAIVDLTSKIGVAVSAGDQPRLIKLRIELSDTISGLYSTYNEAGSLAADFNTADPKCDPTG